jgi:hypothetical protein
MSKIELDPSKLLGIKVMLAARGPSGVLGVEAGAKTGVKAGAKTGVKAGAKVGMKVGVKVGIKATG